MKNSKKWTIVCVCIMLSCMTLFTSVGYAALTGKLEISGTAEWNEPATVFITDIRVQGTNTNRTPTVTKAGFVVIQHGNYQLNRQQGTAAGGTVTITVTVKNNSGIDQYFAQCQTTPALPQRAVVTYPDNNAKPGSVVAHGTTKTFQITIQNTQNSALSMNERESMLVFSPNFQADDTQNASEYLAATFENVLLGKGPDGEGGSITFKGREIRANQIMQTLQDNMESVDTGGYIGNVGNATQDQKDLISAIFGDDLVMQIGNAYYSVSILIKNQQMNDGPNDMVMYITADQLTLGGGTWRNNGWQNLNNVPVYAIVFINDGRNNYTYCDHLFAGEAPVCDFGGKMGEGSVGNFNTNLWNSTDYPDLRDTSGGQITESWSSTNGELDEAYQRYVRENR